MPPPRAVRRLRPTGRLPGAALADPGARQPPGAAVAEPGARPQPGRRGSACIAHRALLPEQDGGSRAAERATPRARQGPRLAPRRVVLSNAACRPAQGSIRLGLGLGLSRQRRRRRRSPPATRIKHGVLHVHKDYEGRLPLCYYDTGLREGGPDDGYACFDLRDILWARRVRCHIERMSDL